MNRREMMKVFSDFSSWAPNSLQMVTAAMKSEDDFFFLRSKITVDSHCSHKIRRQLLLGQKVIANLDSVLKNGDITFPTKVHIVKVMVSGHIWL